MILIIEQLLLAAILQKISELAGWISNEKDLF